MLGWEGKSQERKARIALLSDGIVIEPLELDGPFRTTGVFNARNLTLDLSGNEVVRDAKYEQFVSWLRVEIKEMERVMREAFPQLGDLQDVVSGWVYHQPGFQGKAH